MRLLKDVCTEAEIMAKCMLCLGGAQTVVRPGATCR